MTLSQIWRYLWIHIELYGASAVLLPVVCEVGCIHNSLWIGCKRNVDLELDMDPWGFV